MTHKIKYLLIIAFYAIQALSADGIVLTTMTSNAIPGFWKGSIVRIDIKNNKVVKRDTLHHCKDGLAHTPRFSMDGKHIVFFRDSDAFQLKPGADGADGDFIKGEAKDFLTVMDVDGENKRDIVTFTGAAAEKEKVYRLGYDRIVDWPKGDWIYYQKPQTLEIWQISFKNPSQHKLTTKYPDRGCDFSLRRWNLTADGTRAIRDAGPPSMFPEVTKQGWDGVGLCNHVIYPSGRFYSCWGRDYLQAQNEPKVYSRALGTPGHSTVTISEWHWEETKYMGKTDYHISQLINSTANFRHAWRSLSPDNPLAQDSVPKGGELICTAVNSDKWYITHMGWTASAGTCFRHGANQMLYNWADREFIITSQNRRERTNEKKQHIATAGDFWVKPPKDDYIGTHYEDMLENWLPIGTRSTCEFPPYIRCEGLSNEECALKFDTVCIRTKSVFTKIITRGAVYGDNLDRNNIKIAKNAKVELTVTDQWGDPIWGMGYHEPWDKSTTANTGIYDPDYYKQTPPKVEWSVESNCGSISNDGVFTAGTESGPCKVSANVTVDKVSNAGIVTMLIGDVKVAAKFFSPPVSVKAGAPRMAGKRIIMLPANSRGMATLIDASGKAVYASPVCGSQLHIPRLSSGAYVLHVKNRETVVSAKIFIP